MLSIICGELYSKGLCLCLLKRKINLQRKYNDNYITHNKSQMNNKQVTEKELMTAKILEGNCLPDW